MHELKVKLPNDEYTILIEKGMLGSLGEQVKKLYKNKKIAIITDSNVEALYGSQIEKILNKENYIVKKIIINPGEKSKSFNILERVCEEILEFGLKRDDLILTFGGGVVGDLGGFAASMVLRGIPFMQIPTTLLAQIDSSIGGKVAVNSKNGKNLLGSFYQPRAVFIDPDLLKTLSEKQFNDGLGEVIKYGAIRDEELFEMLESYREKRELFSNIEEIIYRCCSIKGEIVEKDEKDTGERMFLNFGHTIGHGIEKYFNYERYTHGEAIALGMQLITNSSEAIGISKKGTSKRIRNLLIKYELPFDLEQIDKTVLLEIMQHDKKNSNESMNIILLEKIGKCFIKKIEYEEMKKYI